MADIPDWVLVHTASVQTVTGRGSYGPVYAPARDVSCFARVQRGLIRDGQGGQGAGSYMSIRAKLAAAQHLRVGSLVTVGSWSGTVVEVSEQTDGGLGAWQHTSARVEP